MKRLIKVGMLLLFVLTALVAAHAEPTKLELKFNKGDVDKYSYTMKMSMKMPDIPDAPTNMNATISMNVVQRIMDVLPDGSAMIKCWTGDISMDAPFMGKEKGQKIPSKTIYMTMSKEGKVISFQEDEKTPAKPGSAPAFGLQGSSPFGSTFPAEPVDVGSTWDQSPNFPASSGQFKVTAKLESASEKIGDAVALKIVQTCTAHMELAQMMKMFSGVLGGNGITPDMMQSLSGDADMSGTGAIYFSPELGKILKYNGAFSYVMNIGLPAEVKQQGGPSSIKLLADLSLDMKKL